MFVITLFMYLMYYCVFIMLYNIAITCIPIVIVISSNRYLYWFSIIDFSGARMSPNACFGFFDSLVLLTHIRASWTHEIIPIVQHR